MLYKAKNNWKTIDWLVVLLYVLMVAAGWLSICGASYDFDISDFFLSGRPLTQLVWIGISVCIAFSILLIERDFFEVFSYYIYIGLIILLIATIIFAPDIKGSRSWLVIGPLRLQPAEFAKFATALAVARLIGTYGFVLTRYKNFMMALGIIFLPMLCILLQKETGSALVYFAFFLMLYREGMSGYVLLAGVCAVMFFVISMKYSEVIWAETELGFFIVSLMILAISMALMYFETKDKRPVRICFYVSSLVLSIALIISHFYPFNLCLVVFGLLAATIVYLLYESIHHWVWHYALIALFALASIGFMFSVNYVFNEILEPHQQVRIKVSLGLEDDPSGVGYNVNQSKIAIGSGGLYGKGFLNGTQTKLKYVPEQATDFIFCTVGEEQGFLGTTAVLILFTVFILRLILLAERQDTVFARVYGYSVASIFIFHLAINIGMVIGLTPVIGIPLPFFSYGGSSLLGFTVLLFIFLRLDAARKER